MSSSTSQTSSTAGGELPKAYRPSEHEQRIWQRWEEARAFHADPGRVLRKEAQPYCIVIPPPNVTDRLHLGHALNNSIQDILARAHRMMGFETLWMPGTDHAGIATQAVVERRIKKDENLTRQQLGREKFIERVQAFKDEYEAVITGQLKAMGCSCDWDRQRFTMDDVCAKAVREAFFRLFKDKLIYRGKRLVNWDPSLQTAVADDECYDEEVDGAFYYLRYPLVRRMGTAQKPEDSVPVSWSELASRGYPADEIPQVDDEAGAWVTVATTRPETYLGDTAVALSPHDPRAKALRGLFVELPLVGRVIPIIEDSYVVLPERYARNDEEKNDPKAKMATGFLKVTPAHDQNDYELGQRHAAAIGAWGNPVMINVFAPDATISDKHGFGDVGGATVFVGKKREEARKLVVKEFEARGLFEGSKPTRHSLKHSDRSKAVVEPYLSDQWYVRVTDPAMAQAANAALVHEQRSGVGNGKSHQPVKSDGSLRFHPPRYAKSYEMWHDNIRDWCISRQLWWGHRIPVWSCKTGLTADLGRTLETWASSGRIALGGTLLQATEASPVFVCVADTRDKDLIQHLESQGFQQDPDVLDTWFSSALWPMSTMGWPAPKEAGAGFEGLLEAFNPTSTLCTAREIITLWVSRMVMFNRYFLGKDNGEGAGRGQLPFRDVFIHSVIQDGEGRKMSKSLGNGVDPLDIIASHGSDAMRFTLCHMTTQTQDVRMPVVKDGASGRNTSPKFDFGRNFANKLWNAARFTLGILEAGEQNAGTKPIDPATLSLTDRWMLSRLETACRDVTASIKGFYFSEYAQTVYNLLWNDFCDWYLEAIKPTVAGDAAQRSVLAHALDIMLRLLHPVMPYVTETIYERSRLLKVAPIAGIRLAPARKGDLLATAGWPEIAPTLRDEAAQATFERMRGLVTSIREVRSQQNVAPKRRITVHAGRAQLDAIAGFAPMVTTLAGVAAFSPEAAPAQHASFTFDAAEWRLSDLADGVDSGAEKSRLSKAAEDLAKSVATLEGRLANPGYAQKAPPHMVKQTEDQLAKAKAELAATHKALEALG